MNTVFDRNFLEYLQLLDISSLLLFSVDISGSQIKYFSHKHKLHLLLTLEYDRACLTFRHLMLYEILLSFKLQMYLLNSVACLYRSFLNEHTWFLYLNLNVVLQRPLNVSFEVGVVTSAWWIIFWSLHFPSMEQGRLLSDWSVGCPWEIAFAHAHYSHSANKMAAGDKKNMQSILFSRK